VDINTVSKAIESKLINIYSQKPKDRQKIIDNMQNLLPKFYYGKSPIAKEQSITQSSLSLSSKAKKK